MARELICTDVSGMPECDFLVQSSDDNEILRHSVDHLSRIHNMQASPDLENKARSAIHNV